jgi:DNA-binding FadR family transcriptional regulator
MGLTGLATSPVLCADSTYETDGHARAEPVSADAARGAVEMAVLRIGELIRARNLNVGARLPSERDLAKMFGVGRPAIREAVRALCIMGVVETRRGSGSYVVSPVAEGPDWPARIQLNESNFPLLQLLEVRQMFEPKAASLAASRATDAQLRRLEVCIREQEASPTRDVLERSDLQFHTAIIEAAGNPVLVELANSMYGMLATSRRLTARTTPDILKIIRQHRTIFEAISLGHSELAEAAMSTHLRTVGLDIISETAGTPSQP